MILLAPEAAFFRFEPASLGTLFLCRGARGYDKTRPRSSFSARFRGDRFSVDTTA